MYRSLGLDVNEKDKNGDTPLHYVVKTRLKNYFEITKLLADNKADLCSKNNKGNTIAHQMAISEDVSCDDFRIWVEVMIKNGHHHLFTTRGFMRRTPLQASMERMDLDLETIKLIIELTKLHINLRDEQSNTILHLALENGRSLSTIKNLVNLGADWKKKGMNDCSVMHCAVKGSNREAFLYFKSCGADVNARDKYDRTTLHYVALTRSKDYLGMTKFLLKNGTDLYAKGKDGKTLDHFMSSHYWSPGKITYGEWKDGMILMGHKTLFEQESS